jgi:hypothetical protein
MKMPKNLEKILGPMPTLPADVSDSLKFLKEYQDKFGSGPYFQRMFDNFLLFIMQNFERQDVIDFMKIALEYYKLMAMPHQLKNFDKFHKEYGAEITGATVVDQ